MESTTNSKNVLLSYLFSSSFKSLEPTEITEWKPKTACVRAFMASPQRDQARHWRVRAANYII